MKRFCSRERARGRGAHRAAAALLAIAVAAGPAAAQVDPSGSWRTWHTEHFRVHAHERLAAEALVAAREAERAYALLSAELVPPRGTVDLVLADNVDYANGFATVFPSNRFTVYLAPPDGTSSLRYYDGWLRLVIVHELAHVFQLDRTAGVWSVLQRVFGRVPVFFPNVFQASWVTEGLATYYESRFTTAGRVRGAEHRMLLAAAAGGAWVRDVDATLVSPKWPAGARPYAWGAEFFRLMATSRGDSVVPRFVRQTSRQWWPLGTSRPLSLAGGVGVTEAWDRLRRTADSASIRRSGVVEVVERGLRQEPGMRTSPDRRLLAYVRADGKSEPTIVVRALTDGAIVAQRRVNGLPELAWVGDTLYVTQLDFASPVEVRGDLYRWVPGGTWARVTSGARLATPFATPGAEPAALDVGAGRRRAVVARDGELRGFPLPRGDGWGRIDASADGTRLIGARHLDGRWDVVVWPSGAPEEAVALTADDAVDEDPVWWPDARAVLFASEREGFPQIFRLDLPGGRLTRLTHEPTGARGPAVGPDGSLLGTVLYHDGQAIVRFAPVSGVAAATDDVAPSGFVPAPDTPVSEGGYTPWGALRPHYWFPLAYAEGQTGTFFGGFTSGVDAVGRTAYGLWAGVAPDPLRWEGGASVTHTRWRHVALDLSAAQIWDGYRLIDSTGQVVPLGERERVAAFGISARWRRWRTAVAARAAAEWEHDYSVVEGAVGDPRVDGPGYVGAVGSLSVAHWLQPALAISPENGGAVSVSGRRHWSISNALWWWSVRATATGYLALPLPGFAHWVLAGRVVAGWSGGTSPKYFSIGGESSEVVETVPGLPFGAGRRAFPLRGYPPVGGFTRARVAIAELRVPLALVGRGTRAIPLVLDRLSLTVFGEAGGGWNAIAASERWYADLGSELVVDLGVMRDVPMRLRIGAGVPLCDGAGVTAGEVRAYVAAGTSF